jgi:protein-tyrosine-phosphatase/DNA-binding transcriptional ArsR family regulator
VPGGATLAFVRSTTGLAEDVDMPPFLALVANPLRWRLLGELASSDRPVRELTARVGASQNLVSYHLARLRAGGLVSTRRSSADQRDTYYAMDLARCRDLFQTTGSALHPGLRLRTVAPCLPTEPGSAQVPRVLFLCTGNSARSQMAEALLEHLSHGSVRASSAGSHPKHLHPNAVRVMRSRGLDIRTKRAKHLNEFAHERFDFVITLCDRVREVCPEFPGPPDTMHWSIPDPGLAGDTDEASYPAFERTASELETRVLFLLYVIQESSDQEVCS